VILLIYLIKQRAEQRSTRSWEMSIENAVREIYKINRRRKSKGYFLNAAELREILAEGYDVALKKAAIEAFEGRYETATLGERVDREVILAEALKLLTPKKHPSPPQSLSLTYRSPSRRYDTPKSAPHWFSPRRSPHLH